MPKDPDIKSWKDVFPTPSEVLFNKQSRNKAGHILKRIWQIGGLINLIVVGGVQVRREIENDAIKDQCQHIESITKRDSGGNIVNSEQRARETQKALDFTRMTYGEFFGRCHELRGE